MSRTLKVIGRLGIGRLPGDIMVDGSNIRLYTLNPALYP